MRVQVLDSIIGLVAAFLLVSIMASAAVELGSTLFQKRSKDLQVVLDRITMAHADNALDIHATSVWQTMTQASRRKRMGGLRDKRTPSYISARSFADAVTERLRRIRQGDETLRQVIDRLPDSPLRHRLVELHHEVGEDLLALKAGLERWFDDTMDRMQGAYKRWSQWCLLLFGIAFAAALNISAVRIIDSLWNDATLGAAVATSVDEVVSECPEGKEPCTETEKIEHAIQQVHGLGVPMGWGRDWAKESGAGWTLLGILPTGLAAVMGAPFWFDLLKRLVGARGGRGVPSQAANDGGSATMAMTKRDGTIHAGWFQDENAGA